MKIQTVGVVGAGTMGNGIAQVFAGSNFKVILFDINNEQLEKGLNTISGSLDRIVKKEKITEAQKQATLDNIQTTTSLDDFSDVELVVEAAKIGRAHV